MCMANKHRIIGAPGQVNGYTLCTRNPIRGNQHQQASRYCPLHNDGPNILPEVLDVRPITRQFAKSLPNVITSEEGCKKRKDIETFYDRSAGMFYVFRSCGIRLSHWEMFTAESLSSVFTWLVDLFSSTPDLINSLTYMYPFSDGCTLFRTVPYDFDNHFFFNNLSPWDPESLFQSNMSHIWCHYLLFCHFHFNDNFLYMGKKLRFFQNFRFKGKVHCCS